MYRAVDQHGQVIDVLVSAKRDKAAARRFFASALGHAVAVEVTTDKAAFYPAVIDEFAPKTFHDTKQYSNNRVEADHGWPTPRPSTGHSGQQRAAKRGPFAPAEPEAISVPAAQTSNPAVTPPDCNHLPTECSGSTRWPLPTPRRA